MLQYHTSAQLRGTPTLMDQKLTITLPPGQPAVMSSPAAAAALALHPNVAASLLQGGVINVGDRPVVTTAAGTLQFHPVATLAGGAYTTTQAQVAAAAPQQQVQAPSGAGLVQLDGAGDTSDEEDEEDDFNEDEDDGGHEEGAGGPEDDNEDGPQEEVEPLNSDDDVSDEEATENFEIDNVVVCQYDKVGLLARMGGAMRVPPRVPRCTGRSQLCSLNVINCCPWAQQPGGRVHSFPKPLPSSGVQGGLVASGQGEGRGCSLRATRRILCSMRGGVPCLRTTRRASSLLFL